MHICLLCLGLSGSRSTFYFSILFLNVSLSKNFFRLNLIYYYINYQFIPDPPLEVRKFSYIIQLLLIYRTFILLFPTKIL